MIPMRLFSSDALEALDDDERAKKNLGRQGEANAVKSDGLAPNQLGIADNGK